ncbi:hypothetical protein BDR07DRAFT_1413170 [Suillus spraguei]|nr:hypothetical protein BDR07DRAFT_1413170 [Suillus spraguei]
MEGYHKFLRTYVAPQAMPALQSPLYPTHGPTLPSTPPTPKPLTPEVTTPANHAIAAQQGPSPSPLCQVTTGPSDTPSQSEIQGTQPSSAIIHGPTLPSTPPMPKPLTPDVTTLTEDSLAGSHPPPLSESTSTEAIPAMTDLITEDSPADSHPLQPLSKSTSAEAAPFESASAEAVPSEFTSAEAAPSGIATVPLIGSRSKRVQQIFKCNEITTRLGQRTPALKNGGVLVLTVCTGTKNA